MKQPVVRFLEEKEGTVSEIQLSLLVAVVRMYDRNGLSKELDQLVANDKVVLSIPCANRFKTSVCDHGLDTKEKLGAVVVASATCPKDPDPPIPINPDPGPREPPIPSDPKEPR